MRRLAALTAAIALATSASAQAATSVVVDFEDGVVGAGYDLGIDNLLVSLDGKVVHDGGNKYLLLTPPTLEVYDPTLFVLADQKWFTPQGKKLGLIQSLQSFDIYASEAGWIRPKSGPTIWLQAGWQTLNGEGCDGNVCQFFIHAPGVRLDNILFSYETVAVPEPATWAMLIAGFGMVGATIRRRRSNPGSLSC